MQSKRSWYPLPVICRVHGCRKRVVMSRAPLRALPVLVALVTIAGLARPATGQG